MRRDAGQGDRNVRPGVRGNATAGQPGEERRRFGAVQLKHNSTRSGFHGDPLTEPMLLQAGQQPVQHLASRQENIPLVRGQQLEVGGHTPLAIEIGGVGTAPGGQIGHAKWKLGIEEGSGIFPVDAADGKRGFGGKSNAGARGPDPVVRIPLTAGHRHTLNDSPHPHVFSAFGLLNTKPFPERPPW